MANEIKSKLLSRAEAAERLGVKVSCLEAWAHRGTPELPYSKIGGLAKYKTEDIDAFIERHRGTSAREIAAAQA
jgi:excisionase family DNA binding protein